MNNSPAVELRNVSKVFADGVKAVDQISLQIPPGRTVALLGPSGCGKTTTLRLINRLEEPSAGEICVRGQSVQSQRPEILRRSIGYVIQEGGLFPHVNVSANVATVLRLLSWPRERVRQRVAEVLELVDLPEAKFGRRMPAQLSGGQRQRVGVARALAADPDILLMDEPFGALDPGTRESLQDEFHKLNTRLRKTVVLVTHDIAEAGRLAEEIVLLEHGRIIQQGNLRELLLRPAGENVRAFLGRRVQWLALEVLTVAQVIAELPSEPCNADAVSLPADMVLGQALIRLAELNATTIVQVDGRCYSANALRSHILNELKMASEV